MHTKFHIREAWLLEENGEKSKKLNLLNPETAFKEHVDHGSVRGGFGTGKIECTNCCEETVDESKQNFYYRDWQGNKWDASIRPICDSCIEAGEYRDEDGRKRLYLGSSRLYKPNDSYGYGYW